MAKTVQDLVLFLLLLTVSTETAFVEVDEEGKKAKRAQRRQIENDIEIENNKEVDEESKKQLTKKARRQRRLEEVKSRMTPRTRIDS